MIQDFYIVHRHKPKPFVDASCPVWSTCLRSLAFTTPAFASAIGDELYSHRQAYKFLLEVICGLHSPIVGETEVFGQFKTFSHEWVKADPRRAGLVQRLLNDAKAIRSQYLSHLGTQSYGSWVRKNLTSKRVHIVGAGSLAREILPYLLKQERDVVLHVREIAKVDFFQGEIRSFKDSAFDHGAVIVAAPLKASELSAWLGTRTAEQVFDLRDTSSDDPLKTKAQTRVLKDIFAQIEKTKSLLQPRLVEVRREVEERCEKVADHSVLRPQGWDDLCA
jgi:glutamyl-tRNA reductase